LTDQSINQSIKYYNTGRYVSAANHTTYRKE